MRFILVSLGLAALALGGCSKADDTVAGGARPGRYAGLGHYEPGRLWTELKRKAEPADPAAAKLADDDEVLVVVDTRTGEVRQCGDLSGYCVSLNPWANSPEMTQGAPAALGKHLAELERDDAAAQAGGAASAR
jgi:hypothetical protein